ncbi:hypothetical protein FEM48_Zijuj02G0128700 [Ziziphus jujuba var. spinosa]|uniref:CCHC-type domain-containing protein n=1 Tax=Ziziphus jujuba var. spinosa TaxID=714518 RepID=A0A978VVU5_ZIZJJ|nr:hypothetical protein FEM48_Zijuj02G0128700 [Ziziphus jujuba var. spinosa]
MFVKGKNLWGHLDGSVSKPKDESNIGKITQWNSNDAQENSTRRFQLELELSEYCQGNLSIQDYYSGFLNLWAEYKELVYASIPPEGLPILQQVHEVSQRDQFLMKLRHEYEPIRVNLMSRIPSPSLETCFAELFREEQRCVTQSVLENKNHQRANPMEIAYATQAKVRDMSKVQCYSCKEYGHIANHCTSTHSHVCYVDSGASNHMVSSPKSLVNVKPYLGSDNREGMHKRLGHPNSRTLLTLLKSGLFLNKSSITSLDLSFACDGCKLGKIPSHFWVEALSTSVHLINRLPSPVLDNETPYFRLYGNNPDYNHLRVFGCLCYAHLPSSDRNKLTAQYARCAFLGYASDRKRFNIGIDDQYRENSQDTEGSSRNPIPASDPPIEQGEFLNLGPDISIGQCDVSNMPDAPPLRR